MVTGPRGPRDVLWRVASQQRGYFTAAQAVDAGYSYQTQRFHAQRGNWLRVDRGIYRFREYSDIPSEENAWLAGKMFSGVRLDIAARNEELARTEFVQLPGTLSFAGIPGALHRSR